MLLDHSASSLLRTRTWALQKASEMEFKRTSSFSLHTQAVTLYVLICFKMQSAAGSRPGNLTGMRIYPAN
jgi:hypothetical protein